MADAPPSTTTPQRAQALDGLRGVLVVAVIAYHLWATGGHWRVDPGSVAVVGFFALSGYLITGVLLSEHTARGRVHMGNFYARRALRLLPALCFFLVVWFAVALIFRHGQFLTTVPSGSGPGTPMSWVTALESVGVALGYLTNLLDIAPLTHLWNGYNPISHLWTLAVEEQFYVLWAPAMLILLKLRRPVATAITAGIALVALLDPFVWTSSSFNRLYFGTDTRCAALFCGAVCAFIAAAGGFRWLRQAWWASAVGAVLLGALVWTNYAMREQGHRVLWCAGLAVASVTMALGAAYLAERPKGLAARLLSLDLVVAVGQRSYALYLWSYVMNTWLRDTGNFESILVITSTFVAAEISYRLVEVPMLRKKGRFTVNAAPAVPAVPARQPDRVLEPALA
jgi:peptidoglycan/LPS O-acetylase OafA/YrhL